LTATNDPKTEKVVDASGNLRVPIPVTHRIGSNLYAALIEVIGKRQDLRLERVDGS